MQFKDYYATLGLSRDASGDEIKRAYRKLARKYHPDVSKEADAEARFKDVTEAYEALKDPERRAAYDEVGKRWAGRSTDQPPPDWDGGFEFSGNGGFDEAAEHSEFFEALFGRRRRTASRAHARTARGQDHHAKIWIELDDACQGATREVALQMPVLDDAGRPLMQTRRIELRIPKGSLTGQQLRLTGQGGPGLGGGPPGDLFLEIALREHPRYRVEGRDLTFDLPVAPWEAALGASMRVATPDGPVELRIPPGSRDGARLRLKGRGIPGDPPGDLYAQLSMLMPPADTEARREAYRRFAQAFETFDPRSDASDPA